MKQSNLIQALTLAGVPISLTAGGATNDGSNPLHVAMYAFDGIGGTWRPVFGSASQGGTVNELDAFVFGNAVALQQDGSDSSFPLFTTLRFGAATIDPRAIRALTAADVVDVSDRPAREIGRAREWGNAQTQVSNSTAAPGAGAVLADTGALAAGDYDFDVAMAVLDTNAVGKGMVVEHRNSVNNATLNQLGGCSSPGNQWLHIQRKTLALNERIRVIAGTAAGAAASLYVSSIARRTAG